MTNSDTKAAIFLGNTAIGKSRAVDLWIKEHQELKIKIISGYVSDAYLFKVLKEHSDYLIVFRDINILGRHTIGIIKALIDEPHLIDRYTFNEKSSGSFIFTGKIILELNQIFKMDFNLNAILNKSLVLHLNMTPEEVKEIIIKTAKIKELAAKYLELTPYPNLRDFKRIEDYPQLLNLDYDSETYCRLITIMGSHPVKTQELKERMINSAFVTSYRNADREVKELIERGIIIVKKSINVDFNIETEFNDVREYIKAHRNYYVRLAIKRQIDATIGAIQEEKENISGGNYGLENFK